MDWMQDAAAAAGRLLRLVQTCQQQTQKRHVIAQRQAAKLPALTPDSPTDAAIHPGIALFLGFIQFRKTYIYQAKHAVRLLFCQYTANL
jgi:hypothetical protein